MEALDAEDIVTERAIFASFGAPPVAATSAGARFLHGASPSTTESSIASPSPWMLPPVGTSVPASIAGSTQTIVASPRHVGSLTLLPPKTPRSLLNSFPITADQCGIVWKFLCDWVQTQVAMEVPATIPRFGTITLKVHAMNIRMPFFEPDQTFLETFALQLMKPTGCPPSYSRANSTSNAEPNSQTSKASDVFAFNYLEMASCCGSAIDAAKAQEWFQAVIQKIGQAMNHCKHGPKSTIEYAIRTGESVVKRNLQRTAATPSAPTPKGNFLTSGDFSQAIQVNPAFECASAIPNFEFELSQNPRRPLNRHNPRQQRHLKATSLPHTALRTASPRSQQLQSRYQKSSQPLVSTSPQSSSRPVVDTSALEEQLKIGTLSPDFPLLFDYLSRTLCVEPDQNVALLVPSNRIASNFTPAARQLVMQRAPVSNANTARTPGAGIVFYEDTTYRGPRTGDAADYNTSFPKILEPGTLWQGIVSTSPGGNKRKAETINCSILSRNQLSSPAHADGNKKIALSPSKPTHESKSEERYFAYIAGDGQLLEHRWLTPLPSQLIERIVSSAVKYLTEPPQGRIKLILNAAQEEFIANYYISAKKAILDYILLREEACQRLRIPHGSPSHVALPMRWKWGNSEGVNGYLPDLKMLARKPRSGPQTMLKRMPERDVSASDGELRNRSAAGKTRRRQRVKAKLSSLYMLSDAHIRIIQSAWHDIESSMLLVNLPSVEVLSSTMEPLNLYSFQTKQLQHAARMKKLLMERWYWKAKSMVEDTVRAQTVSARASAAAVEFRVRHLFDAIGTLMSLQIRSLIVKSVKAYVDFFELFSKPKLETSLFGEDGEWTNKSPSFSGLLISLAMENGEVQFRNPLVDIPSHLLSVLHNLPQLFHNLGRIETQFSEPLQFSTPGAPFLWNVSSQGDDIVLATIRIREIVEQNMCHLRQLQAKYEVFAHTYRYVCCIDTQELGEQNEIAACRTQMETVRATAMRITAETRDKQYLRLFCVDCSHVNASLLSGFMRWVNRLLRESQEHTTRLNAELRHEYKDVAARLAKKPMDLYELVDAEAFVESLKTFKLSELQEKASIIKERIQFLLFERESVYIGYALKPGLPSSRDGDNMEASPFRPSGEIGAGLFRLAPDVLMSTAKTIKWRSHINKLLHDAEASLVDERARIETIFLAKRTRFQSEIEEFDGEVKGFAKKGDLRHAATYVVQLAKMKDTLFSFRKTMEAIIEEETKLQWKTTDFSKLDDIAEEMEPYEQLWKTAREFREMSSRWLRGNLFELDASEGMQALHQMLTIIANVSKILHLNSAGAAITAEMLKKQLTDFRENARLVGAILNPSMKDRHLKEVSALLGLSLDPQDPLTLLKVLEGGALDHLSKILEISQNATQEKQIEDALVEIDIEWRELQFLFKAAKKPNYGSSNLPVSVELQKQRNAPDHPSLEISTLLQRESVEDVTQLVEEHQVRLHSLLCMQHAIPFSQEISSWLHFTRNIRRLLDALIAVERLWKAINPLFSARIVDIDSKETKLFGTADQLYKGVVMRIQRQPLCREVIPRVTQKSDPALASIPQSMLADLKTCLSLLEEAKDTLRVGLDGKRSHFPRFYFLSDLELVSALSCRSASGDLLLEASELWKYLSPCFPGIHRVQVNASREITSLVSSVGEQFTLGTPIATANVSVIAWLGKMETSMTTILQACIRAAISDLGRKEFRKWCLLWPEQILLVTIQYTWTMESEQANKKNSLREAHSAWEAITGNLRDKHVSVGKEMKAATYPHLRMSLSNVLLLLSHLRDVSSRVCQDLLQQALALSRPASTERQIPFEGLPWLAQPRYYYEENALVVKFMTAAPLAYGFEYLGNKSPPFHLMPLTLRCFHAIAQTAGILSKGTCLEGAAGVGKTTLCNAMSQSCGRLFVLYDCANTLSFEFMLQFIKGAASCGTWLAFKSFQLLNPVQVSIVGHLCAHVMDTLTAKNGHCTFLGSKIRLKKGCHFVALCPGPSTQSLLQVMPSEARFFFKRVVLHAPDIKVITESLLHEAKFVNTAALAKLVCVVLNAFEREFSLLCSDPKFNSSFLNLRFVKRIVRRAVELSSKEKPSRHDANVAFTQHLAAQSVTDRSSDPLEVLDVEKLEHKVVCIALREELTATTPAANMDLIEFLLRDFAANSLTREIRITKSFLLTPPQASVGLVPSTLSGEQIESKSQLEDVIEDIVRTKEPVWMAFGPGFSQKIVQLLQHMRANRAVVISGGIQSGKTALYKALARSISALCSDQTGGSARNILRGSAPKTYSNELIASTRCVVLAPRAVTVDKLLGTSAEHFASTLLAHIIQESKGFHEGGCKTNTWLILDGDFDSSWSEKLVCLIEELHGNVAGRRKGLLLSSGKCMLLPRCMRLVMETTTLSNASPSFLTRVGVVNVGQAIQHEWRGFYRAWKKAHELEFDALADEIWGIVDVLVEETVDACLEFVESNFQRGFSQLRVARFKSLLALFHSSIRQSWPKLRSMVSGKQRKTAFHCFYLQALVWGIGNTCDAYERRTFHEFLRHLIIHGPFNTQSSLKRVLILFFPSGTTGTRHAPSGNSAQGGGTTLLSQGAHRSQSGTAMKDIIYAFGFSVDCGLKWMRWTEYYELWLQAQNASSSSVLKGTNDLNEVVTASLTDLIIPSGPQAAAICMVNQLMIAQYPTLLKGLRDSGKSICGSTWLALNSAFSNAQAAAEASLQVGSGNASEVTSSQHVFVGWHTSAADVLEQLVMLLEKPYRKKKDKLSSSESNTTRDPQQQIRHDKSAGVDAGRRMAYVFIDDLHCLDPNQKLDSAVELLRMLVEHRQAIHPTSNQVTSCSNILPLASIQANVTFNTSQHHDTIRLLNRFVPVALPTLTDAELSSICMAIVSPNDPGAALPSADATVRDFHKAHQVFAIVVKCSIKLFRFMSGEFSQCAAKVSFVPSKLHYVFHVHDIFDIVRSVFCDGDPTLTLAEKPYLARLWCHESARTLGDRLIEPKETAIFYQHVRDLALHSFGLAPEVFIPPHADLPIEKTDNTSHLWLANHLHFAFVGESSGAGFMDGYREVTEIQKVELSIERSMMAMYSANMSSEPLEIVICGYVTQHVLRLTRLLRNEDRNILLIGSRGNKMATIARLAAFICRKTAVLYNKPTSSVSQNSESLVEWKHELRNAILASVREKDENIVFIFKDSYLLETGHYDAIERFVSGAQLSSDILAYEHLDGHLLSILRDQMHQEQEESRANKLAAQTILSTESSVLEYFYTQVRKKFQMVVILSDSHANMLPIKNENLGSRTAASRLARLFWQTPRILKHCTVNYFGEWPEESLSTIAHKCFALSSEIEKERAVQFAQAAVQIYQSTRRFYARCSESPEIVKEGREGPTNELLSELDQENEGAVNSVQFSSLDRPLPIQLDPSMLIAQICLFLKFLGRLSREITANKSKYHAGLSFLEQTEQILVAEQAQAEVLQPEMQKRADFTRRMSGTLEKEKIASSKLNRALDLATSLVEAQRERLANVEAEYQELVKDSMAVFKQIQTNIRMFQVAKSEESGEEQSSLDSPDLTQGNNAAAADADKDTESQDTNVESVQESLNRQEGLRSKEAEAPVVECLTQEESKERELKQHRRALIKSFASFKPVPTALMQLAECLGLIFGFQPVEARDKLDPDEIFMDYWESMTARLKTKAFWDELIVFDVEAHVNDKILGQVLPICSSPDFEKEMFASIHELAGSLCEWVQAWSRLARDIVLAGPKFAQLMQEREAFKSAQAEVKARELEIQIQRNTTSEANALRHLSEVERQEIEDRLHDNVSTLQIASSVWKVLASSRKKWKERYQYYTEFSAQWMGDLMIATAIVSYTSYASDKTRDALRANWSNELRKHYLIHSVNRALHEVFLVGNVQLTRWYLDGIPSKDACAVENAVIVSSSYHFPLLLDPYGIAVAWVKQYEAANKLQVLNSQAADEKSLWNEIDTAVKKQNALMLTDFCEESACALRSLIGAKRRALFEVVNRDISSSTVITGNGSSTMPRLGDGSEAVNHPCWFQIPQSAKQHDGSTSLQQQTQKAGVHGSKSTASLSTVVFGSESWRVYFVYSRSESVPEWMLQYASQLKIVRFHFSARFVETHCVSKVADAYGEQHLLTEIQTLQVDILSYQEQIDAIENEILDFFSTEQPQNVYSEVSKALRIIGNRSAMHTLESSKAESESKIRSNRTQLERFAGLVHRGVDFAYAWRDIAWITSEMQLAANENSGRRSDPLFVLPWVWKLLAKALQQYEPHKSFEEMASIYTETVREFVAAQLHDDGQLLFDFVLSLRLHSRRHHGQHHSSATPDIMVEIEPGFEKDPTLSVHKDAEVVCRLMLLLQCEDETQLKQLCSFVPPKLVALRPDSLSPQRWRALCFLADASADLRDFMLQHADRKGKATGHDSWTELLEICSSSNSPNPSPSLNPLNEVVRLCVVCAIHKDLTLREIERFVALELTTCSYPEVAPVSPDPKLSMQTLDGAACPLLVHPGFGSLKVNSFNSLYELWRTFSSSHTPIVVNCAPGFDFVSHVADVALRAKMTMNPSLYETLIIDDAFERNLRTAMQKGHWVVAPNLHTMPQRLARVQKLYQTLEERDLHSDFRLWVSSHTQWADVFVDKWAIRKLQGGTFALKRSLMHVFTVMKDNATCRTLEANYEKVLKRVGLLHAILTTQSHFGFAFWKSEFVFDDGDLQAVIGTLSKLDPQAEVIATEADQLWDIVRGAVLSIYGSSMRSAHDKLLLRHCTDLIFQPPYSKEGGSTIDGNDAMLVAAQHTIPEVVFMLQTLEKLPWKRITEQSWCEEESGHDAPNLIKSWDSICLHARRRQGVVQTLCHLLDSGGRAMLSTRTRLAAAALQGQPFIESPMESIMKFAVELESLVTHKEAGGSASDVAQEYKKPFLQLVRHEIALLDGVKVALVKDIRRFQAIHGGAQQLDAATWIQFCEIRRGCAPRSWMKLLAPLLDIDAGDECSLAHFQFVLTERIKFFMSSLVDGGDMPAKIPIDLFHSSECVFETIHQHFIRNHVGNTLCDPNCLRVINILEDRGEMHALVSKNDDSLFLHGLRLMGRLQLQVVRPRAPQSSSSPSERAPTRKSVLIDPVSLQPPELHPEGIAVVLEVTSACMATLTTPSSAAKLARFPTLNELRRENSKQLLLQAPQEKPPPATLAEYLCPIYRSDAAPGLPRHPETSLCVMTALPEAELCFSGSSFIIHAFKSE